MSDKIIMTGMILSVMPVGDYDKRVVLLTKEAGRISAFARGARRPKSPMIASTTPMAFGTFELFMGRNSNALSSCNIDKYFMDIAKDYDSLCMASYFLEMADYYAQENTDEAERLLLLYQSLRALESKKFSLRLIRSIYEIRTMVINGEYPDMFSCGICGKKENLTHFSVSRRMMICSDCSKEEGGRPISASALYACQYIMATLISKLFSISLDQGSRSRGCRNAVGISKQIPGTSV